MTNIVDWIELVLRWLATLGGAGTLAFAIINMLKAQRRPSGVVTGAATKVLRTSHLVIATLLFIAVGYILWKPLPINLSWQLRLAFILVGGVLFFAGLFVYRWGLRTLGANFNAASGFGVRLHQAHTKTTSS